MSICLFLPEDIEEWPFQGELRALVIQLSVPIWTSPSSSRFVITIDACEWWRTETAGSYGNCYIIAMMIAIHWNHPSNHPTIYRLIMISSSHDDRHDRYYLCVMNIQSLSSIIIIIIHYHFKAELGIYSKSRMDDHSRQKPHCQQTARSRRWPRPYVRRGSGGRVKSHT
jgi:hypothetical protein